MDPEIRGRRRSRRGGMEAIAQGAEGAPSLPAEESLTASVSPKASALCRECWDPDRDL